MSPPREIFDQHFPSGNNPDADLDEVVVAYGEACYRQGIKDAFCKPIDELNLPDSFVLGIPDALSVVGALREASEKFPDGNSEDDTQPGQPNDS